MKLLRRHLIILENDTRSVGSGIEENTRVHRLLSVNT